MHTPEKTKTYYHFSNWAIAQLKLNEPYSTPTESYYWQRKLTSDSYNDLNDLFNVTVLKHGKYAAELLKEYIFEEVRVKLNPALPARKKCMFLFDKDIDTKPYAENMKFNLANRTLLEIQPLDGVRLHRADMRLLDSNLKQYAELVEIAKCYWQGYTGIDVNSEVLFEGNFTIINIVGLSVEENLVQGHS